MPVLPAIFTGAKIAKGRGIRALKAPNRKIFAFSGADFSQGQNAGFYGL